MIHIVSFKIINKDNLIFVDNNLEYNISKKQTLFSLYSNKQGLFGNSVSWGMYWLACRIIHFPEQICRMKQVLQRMSIMEMYLSSLEKF